MYSVQCTVYTTVHYSVQVYSVHTTVPPRTPLAHACCVLRAALQVHVRQAVNEMRRAASTARSAARSAVWAANAMEGSTNVLRVPSTTPHSALLVCRVMPGWWLRPSAESASLRVVVAPIVLLSSCAVCVASAPMTVPAARALPGTASKTASKSSEWQPHGLGHFSWAGQYSRPSFSSIPLTERSLSLQTLERCNCYKYSCSLCRYQRSRHSTARRR